MAFGPEFRESRAVVSLGVVTGPIRPILSRAVRAVLIAVPMLAGCAHGAGPDGVVHSRAGAVRGTVAADHVLFQGIPYGAPPVGPLRWQPPQPVAPWPGVRDATTPATRCVQDTTRDPDYGRPAGEDCLSLDVWSPTGARGRPVMVWIHGGAFANGSADIYDARRLAIRGNIVVVTVNYRLGAPGFLAHPALGPPGNYGLADQQAALRWVRDNIGAFGGDPDQVTVAGQSAGGISVCDHLVAPGSAGLFRAAIIASGPCTAQATPATAEPDSRAWAAERGCADPATAAACLRALPAAKLAEPPWFVHIGGNQLSGPVVGTPVLPVEPVAAISAGHGRPVPLLVGSTRDEFTFFMALRYLRLGTVPAPAEYPGLLAEAFGPRAGAVAAHYPLDRFGGSVAAAYSAAVTDAYFSCVGERMAVGQAAVAPVYAYEFADPRPPTPDALQHLPFELGASHGLDLRYLFDIGGAPALTPAQQRLSDQMIDYWTSFVSAGTPHAPGAPDWPALRGADGPRMSFGADGPRVGTTFARDHQCAFWAGP